MNTALAVPLSVRLYGDIIRRERPVHHNDLFSRRHPKMSRLNRAKLFAPFAALDGFESRVRGKEVAYVQKHELDADEVWELNRRLNILAEMTRNSRQARQNHVTVNVEYFELCSDPDNEAFGVNGSYHTVVGSVQYVDHVDQMLLLSDGQASRPMAIPFSDIYAINDLSGGVLSRNSNSGPRFTANRRSKSVAFRTR